MRQGSLVFGAIGLAVLVAIQCAAQPIGKSEFPRELIPPLPQPRASGKVLKVGANRELKVPSEAAKVAKDGDTIEIDAGEYLGDVALWPQSNLTIRGVGGRAVLRALGRSMQGKAIWVIDGGDLR